MIDDVIKYYVIIYQSSQNIKWSEWKVEQKQLGTKCVKHWICL